MGAGETFEVRDLSGRLVQQGRNASGEAGLQPISVRRGAHLLRILSAVWLDLPAERGVSFVLEPTGAGVLGYERDTPALRAWTA